MADFFVSRLYGGCPVDRDLFRPASPLVWLICQTGGCRERFQVTKKYAIYRDRHLAPLRCPKCKRIAGVSKTDAPADSVVRRGVEMLRSGKRPADVSRACRVSPQTVSRWKLRWVVTPEAERVPALEARIAELEKRLAEARS